MGDIGRAFRKIIKTAQTREVECYPDACSEDTVVPIIRGFDGTGAPEFTKERISFNGDGGNGFDHETFYIAAKRELESWQGPDRLGWAFCKTAHKPYDIVVTACLTLLNADYGFEVSSDGDMEDWEPGVKLAEEALDRQFANPLIVDALTA
jgi:hypothetical protein